MKIINKLKSSLFWEALYEFFDFLTNNPFIAFLGYVEYPLVLFWMWFQFDIPSPWWVYMIPVWLSIIVILSIMYSIWSESWKISY